MSGIVLYIFLGAAFIILLVVFGFWVSQQEKKRFKQAEEFYALPQIKALLESGFVKGDDAIEGEVSGYRTGLYCWFEIGGPRYFTYMRCEGAGFSAAFRISEKYRVEERIRIKDGALQQELKQIDGATLAKSFARLREIMSIEKLKPSRHS